MVGTKKRLRIVTPEAVYRFIEKHPQAKAGLMKWLGATAMATWGSLDDVRAVFPHADQVIADSGKPVVVFNIAGNKYRLVVAIHFNTRMVYVLRFMTHAEYDKDQWKDQL